MQITVKSAKVLKSGTNKQGEWELVGVMSEDGTSYTTFNKGAKGLPSGTVIDIEPIEDDQGRLSFKEFEVKSMAKPEDKPQMTPDKWAEKDKAQASSIESQVAFKGVVELLCHDYEISKELREAAFNWAMLKLNGVVSPSTPPQPAQKATSEPSEILFPNIGEFYTACLKTFKLSKSNVDAELGESDLSTPEQRSLAWLAIKAVHGEG